VCRECGFEPETPEDKAQALMLSDHNLPPEQLEVVSQKIKSGERPALDEAACIDLTEEIRQHPELMKMPLGCVVIPWILMTLMVLLVIAVAAVFFPKLIAP
jgi:hypothetical protein